MKLNSLFNFPYSYTRFDGKLGLVTQFFGESPERYRIKYGLKGHNGIDLGVPTGTEIIAPIDMTISFAGVHPKSGNVYVVGEHDEGDYRYELRFLHLLDFNVVFGQKIKMGERIAVSNNTGDSSGPHLHFGIRLWRKVGTAWVVDKPDNGYFGFVDPINFVSINNQKKEIMGLKLKIAKDSKDVYAITPDGKKDLILNVDTFVKGNKLGFWGSPETIEVVDKMTEPDGDVIVITKND